MFNENILTYGVHPSEFVILLIFIWAAYLFISIRCDVVKTALFKEDYYIYWVDALVFLCLQQFFDLIDNIPDFRIFNYLEHAAFVIASLLLCYAIYKSYRKYKTSEEAIK